MNKVSVLAVIGLTGLVSACAAPQESTGVVGPMWQVTDIYTEPENPSAVPPSAAGAAALVFGETSATGFTGCSPIQASVTFDAEESVLTFDEVAIPAPEDCTGGSAWTHESMSSLVQPGNSFDMRRPSPSEMVLTLRVDEINRPSLRLAAP